MKLDRERLFLQVYSQGHYGPPNHLDCPVRRIITASSMDDIGARILKSVTVSAYFFRFKMTSYLAINCKNVSVVDPLSRFVVPLLSCVF